jgi:uncharacterized protein
MRFLLLIIAIVLGILILKQLYGSRKKTDNRKIPQTTAMVRCEQCGVHIPRDEAQIADGKYFCSDEHRKLYHS